MISAIVAVDNNYGIGNKDNLLAHIPEDLKMFKEVTTDSTVIVGRKTYDTLPTKPLPNRLNIIITSSVSGMEFKIENNDVVVYSNMDFIKEFLSQKDVVESEMKYFIIGGGAIYKELLPYCNKVYLTKILYDYNDVDTYFPNIDEIPEWKLESESEAKEHEGIQYKFCVYNKLLEEV